MARILAGTARRILRVLERRGLDPDEDSLASDDPLLALLTAASIRSRIATGPEAGEGWRRLGDRVEPLDSEEGGVEPGAQIPPRCVREGGMSLHADVAVPSNDRRRLERLCRYVARPPLALNRLEAMADGRLAYRLKTRWRDGTTHVVMERRELLERLAPLIPPPRAHQVRYHGVLAPCATGRDRVIPSKENREACLDRMNRRLNSPSAAEIQSPVLMGLGSRPLDQAIASNGMADETAKLVPDRHPTDRPWSTPTGPSSEQEGQPASHQRILWAELLQRVFEVDALGCPKCGGRMRVLSAITDLDVAVRILRCPALPPRAPPLAGSRKEVGPSCSKGQLFSDATPEFDFDQSEPPDDDRSA